MITPLARKAAARRSLALDNTEVHAESAGKLHGLVPVNLQTLRVTAGLNGKGSGDLRCEQDTTGCLC